MKRNLLTILILLSSIIGYCQISLLKTEAETKDLSKRVTELFKQGRVAESFIELRKYWPLAPEEINRIEQQTATHLTVMNQRFGRTIRTLKYREEKITDMAVREVYFIQYQYTAIRLVFTYYHNPEGWIVHAFTWDDSFNGEFRQ